ncbi:YadA domain-containing structural protein [Synechococcus phage S-CAM22]|uniref:YadA domain-containing structural protein n=1 Tax=Synechococcus phage S-CAM22 TaxID=1883365 RepID=A0A1D8KQ95_9CAUD|nr:virion structural protein [Synechococcus phage S-CAM22]YP_010088690.1 virion structural protein [Synechococcus phage S-CAM22]AOV60861.1 YadA domain-containing structural protein [Synechococcus phage S-CAM22]AOV61075.1 YadA domain-containing structural protein [Synechococcus phage S-CAM22]AOV61289.1 YadA domain-containing structural protein [Synechococcus phage S-CAM22]
MGTRKISQLDTISDANLSGEGILPVVVSDPLIPNRKVKINQLHKGVAQGSKSAPGLSFDLDRNTGLYQSAYDEIGIGFGDSGLYMTTISNTENSKSLYITAVHESSTNADIVLAPKGTGAVKVTGNFVISDQTFILEDAQGPKARFEVSNVGTGTNTRVMTLPAITSGNGTTLVGADTQQTLTNKTVLIDEDNLVITDGDDEAIFQLNWTLSQDIRRSYLLPDAGTVTTTAEPTATSSTLLDTKAEQTVLNKSFVDVKFLTDAEIGTAWAQINTDALTANRTITVPDLSLTLVGTDSTQILENKTIENLILQDPTDNSKKVSFSVTNQNASSNQTFEVPPTNDLNNGSDNSTLVTATATQNLSNKSLVAPIIKQLVGDTENRVTLDLTNITGSRTIKFPDSNATLLSTENVTLEDVTFGAGIGGNNLTGLTRQQQFFYSGF